jgi:hypothetical protein
MHRTSLILTHRHRPRKERPAPPAANTRRPGPKLARRQTCRAPDKFPARAIYPYRDDDETIKTSQPASQPRRVGSRRVPSAGAGAPINHAVAPHVRRVGRGRAPDPHNRDRRRHGHARHSCGWRVAATSACHAPFAGRSRGFPRRPREGDAAEAPVADPVHLVQPRQLLHLGLRLCLLLLLPHRRGGGRRVQRRRPAARAGRGPRRNLGRDVAHPLPAQRGPPPHPEPAAHCERRPDERQGQQRDDRARAAPQRDAVRDRRRRAGPAPPPRRRGLVRVRPLLVQPAAAPRHRRALLLLVFLLRPMVFPTTPPAAHRTHRVSSARELNRNSPARGCASGEMVVATRRGGRFVGGSSAGPRTTTGSSRSACAPPRRARRQAGKKKKEGPRGPPLRQ